MNKKGYLIFSILLLGSFLVDKQITFLIAKSRIALFDAIALSFLWESTIVFIISFLILFLSYKKDKWAIIKKWSIAFFSTGILIVLLKIAVARIRPFEALSLELIKGANYNFAFWNTSFPSWHTASAAALLPLITSNKRLEYLWFFYILIIALSRLYLGVHYLSDVLAGAIIGYFISLLVRNFKK